MKKDIDAKMAEEMLISSLIYKPDKIIEVIDEVNPDIFSVKEFGQIYRCIVDLYKDDIIPDEVTIVNKANVLGFEVTPELVKKLANGKTFVVKRQLRKYCDIIKTSAFKRKTVNLCTDFLEKAQNIGNPEIIVNDFFNLAIKLNEQAKAQTHESNISIDKESLLDSLEDRYNNPNQITGIPFGFPTIDKYIDGAQNGYIYSLCGHNGHCKSLFSQMATINMALWLIKNKIKKKVLFFSLEMTKEQMENRFISMITGIEHKYFKNPRLYFIEKKIEDTRENFEKFKQNIANATDFINQLPIVINDASDLSVMQIVAMVKKYMLKEGVACVYVDYAGLVINDEAEEYQNIAKTYQVLKQTAKDIQVPFIILNQYLKSFTPNPKNANRGTLFDIYGGKSVLNDSHVIMHVNFPQKCREYIQDHPEMIGKVIVYCDKNRDNTYGEMPDVIFQLANGQLKEDIEIKKEVSNMAEKIFAGVS